MKDARASGTILGFSEQVNERVGAKDSNQRHVIAGILSMNLDCAGQGNLQLERTEPQER